MEKSDDSLIKETIKGDTNAFRVLVDRYHKQLINFFYYLTWDRHISEDLSLEVFIKVFKVLDKYKSHGRFLSYLFTIAKNHWIDYIRVRKSLKRSQPVSLSAEKDGDMSIEKIFADAKVDDPPHVLMKQETTKYIRDILSGLPEEQRVVIILSEFQGLTYEEIAQSLKIPIGTVKSRIHNAFINLKKILKHRLEE